MPIQLLTAQEVCNSLQISTRTLRRIVKDGRLRPIRVRGAIRFRQPDVEYYVDEMEGESTTRAPTLEETPSVIAAADDLLKRWNEAIEALQYVVSEWAALPPSHHPSLEYTDAQIDRVNAMMQSQLAPWLTPVPAPAPQAPSSADSAV